MPTTRSTSRAPRRTTSTVDRTADQHPGAWSSPGFLLWHATLRWQRHVGRALEPLGLTYAQFSLLAGVWWLAREHGHDPSQRELADHTGIDPVMTSKVVRGLEDRGLVGRVADDHDQRVRRLRLTDPGLDLAQRAVAVVDATDDEFFGPVAAGTDLVPVLRGIARRDAAGRVTAPEAPLPATARRTRPPATP